ncbi:hypothetical protein HPB50_011809 [Hyalomma asiaticum]|uniref:Uncharacterized protein n=1 Tax=Hyalomma asiaticum TaxID=266040 RepID=A0ACB7RWQ6_HYAAI|nr:hypothetical protein HPB50_011809 [Hyalomma asiaticum]
MIVDRRASSLMKQRERSADKNSNRTRHRTRSDCSGKTNSKSSNIDGTSVQTLSSRNYLHPATLCRLPNRYPEKAPHHQAGRKPGQGPDPAPLTQKSESLRRKPLGEKLIRRCKENDTANQASKPQGTPPLSEHRVKEIIAMEVRKETQIMAAFAGEIRQQLQQHITIQLAPIHAIFQELSTFVSYAKQNHITKATVENILNSTEAACKKARKDLHNASRPESMTLDEDRQTAQDGD